MKAHTTLTLQKYLKFSGESQSSFARRLGITQSMVSMLARGQRVPHGKLALKIHELTGVSLEVLLAPRPRRRKTTPTTPPTTTDDHRGFAPTTA